MNDCHLFRNLIDEYLDGTISEHRRQELEAHARACRDCAGQLRSSRLIPDVIADAFVPATVGQEAKDQLLAKLADQRLHPVSPPTRLFVTARLAAAAGVLLAAGLALGWILGHPGPAPLPPQVPLRVADLAGMVLVRHSGAEVWHTLTPEAAIHIGDAFHAADEARLTLQMPDTKSTIRIDQNSMLTLKSYNGETQFYLEHGQCKASLDGPHGPFFISTPHGRVEALGTEFTVKVE
jgi:ferric-dicitrate binding protein FerR (iron transport regulator)